MGVLTESQTIIICDTCGDADINGGQGRKYSLVVFRRDGWSISGKKATCPQCRKERTSPHSKHN